MAVAQNMKNVEFSQKLRRRSFTWFNYTDADVEYLQNIPAEKADYVCWGFEVTEDGKAHLQGYIEFAVPISGAATVLRLTRSKAKNPGLTVLKLVKDNRDVQINYCRKEESTDEQAVAKWGAKFFEKTNKERKQGERTDWHKIHDMINDDKKFIDVAESFPEHAIKYHGGIDRLIRAVEEKHQMEAFVSKYDDAELRPWQAKICNELRGVADDRKIIWVYDTVGNIGKSWFAKYLVAKHGAARFPNCRTQDLAMAYKGEPIVAFDFSRTVEGRINYSVIESLKDGEIFSSKYESRVKRFGTPHIICFANWAPCIQSMSADRWSIRCMDRKEDEQLEEQIVNDLINIDHLVIDDVDHLVENNIDNLLVDNIDTSLLDLEMDLPLDSSHPQQGHQSDQFVIHDVTHLTSSGTLLPRNNGRYAPCAADSDVEDDKWTIMMKKLSEMMIEFADNDD